MSISPTSNAVDGGGTDVGSAVAVVARGKCVRGAGVVVGGGGVLVFFVAVLLAVFVVKVDAVVVDA